MFQLWVSAHSDIEGNEVADVLAKGGAREAFTGPNSLLRLHIAW